MLENDLLLARFLDAAGATLTEQDITDLDSLLDMTDNELWDVLAGRAEPDWKLRALVARLRAL